MDFKFHQLETITNNFSEKVGSGGYGDVYKGMYNGDEIAVKKLHGLHELDDNGFEREFRNLSNVHHKNIIRIIGYCYETRHLYVPHKGELVFAEKIERVLCFEFMHGGSLDHHITDDSCGLDWPKCYKIIKGTCEGLNHLHNSNKNPIFHMDLKPANILLDKNMTAKIADLGLSKLVASTQTYKSGTIKGSQGFMPPEYINAAIVSNKFDVFSLGVIIIKILDGNKGYSRLSAMGNDKFVEFVCENWKKRQQAKSGYSSDETEEKRVKKCIEIALKCVVVDRRKRPLIIDIVDELEKLEDEIRKMLLSSDLSEDRIARQQKLEEPEELEDKIRKMSPSSDLSEDRIARQQRSPGSYVFAVDPALELRFLLEPRKDISSCLQLINMTGGFIAFDIKANHTKYRAQPREGVMPPCSKRYILVTLIAQEAPQNMHCNDLLVVQAASISKDLTLDKITEDFFKKAMAEKVVDIVELPIVYVAQDQFEH